MSDEGKKDVDVKPVEATEKHPDSVPWTQHVAAKETISKKLIAAEEKATSLEEKLKSAPDKAAYDAAVKERDEAKAKVQELTDEKVKATEKTATELRETLKKLDVPEEKVKSMSVAEMQTVLSVLGSKKSSLPDLGGGGGGSGGLKGSPMELATRAYESSNKSKK